MEKMFAIQNAFNKCQLLMNERYDEAIKLFEELGNYSDSKTKIRKWKISKNKKNIILYINYLYLNLSLLNMIQQKQRLTGKYLF